MISDADMVALLLTLQVAATSTVILLLLGAPLAWWLSRTRSRFKVIVETLTAMPLVLPPTVIGFYLLLAFAPDTPLAKLWQSLFDTSLAFSFSGLVIGSVIYSLPFVVQPLQGSYERIPQLTLMAAATLGANRLDRFLSVVLPASRRATLAAAALAFTHTIGEFGVVLMIGGNIPGETQLVSIALYDHVEALQYADAHALAMVLVAISFLGLLGIYSIGNRPSTLMERHRASV